MKEKIYSLLKLLLCFIFFFCIGDIFSYVLGIFGIDVTKFSNKILVIYQFIMSFIIFIVLFFIYKKIIKKDYESFRKEKNKNITYGENGDYILSDIIIEDSKTLFKLANIQYETPLFGKYNIYNIINVIIILNQLNIGNIPEIIKGVRS